MFYKQRNFSNAIVRCFTIVVLFGALAAGCDTTGLTDAFDDFNVVIGLDPIETTVSGLFVDAKTGELIEQPVTVTFKGPNGNDVIDMFSKSIDRQEVDGGLTSFGLSNSLNPSAASPAKVTVVAESEGYIGNGRTVTVTSEGETTFIVYMVDPDNAPEGSNVRNESQGDAGSDGAIQQDVSVSSGTEQQSSASASIDLNQGTVLSDADGGTLNGNLTTTLGYYNNSSGQSLKTFPGDFESPDGGNLVTAGFTSIDIRDADGTEAATFSDPMVLTTEIPDGMTNPGTGQAVKAGDEINVYSYDTNNGAWVNEGTAMVQGPRSNGNFFVEYQADHLSFWGAFFPNVATCTSGATITINRNGNTGPLDATITGDGINIPVTIPAGVSSISIPGDLGLESVPAVDATMTINTGAGEVSQTGNMCSGNYTFSLQQPPADQVEVTMDVQLQCPNPDEYVRVTDIPTATVRFKRSEAGGADWKTVTGLQWDFNEGEERLEGGSFTVHDITDGASYDFKIHYDGTTYDRTGITLNAPTTSYTEDISGDDCS